MTWWEPQTPCKWPCSPQVPLHAPCPHPGCPLLSRPTHWPRSCQVTLVSALTWSQMGHEAQSSGKGRSQPQGACPPLWLGHPFTDIWAALGGCCVQEEFLVFKCFGPHAAPTGGLLCPRSVHFVQPVNFCDTRPCSRDAWIPPPLPKQPGVPPNPREEQSARGTGSILSAGLFSC
jgi:hypothetical protein